MTDLPPPAEPRPVLIHGGPHDGQSAPVARYLSLPCDGGGRAEYGLVWVGGAPEWHFRRVK